MSHSRSKFSTLTIFIFCFTVQYSLSCLTVCAEDWPRFRGPAGMGVTADSTLPTQWSPNVNLGWKSELPGPGASSPIIVGNKTFVTCYSGYGVDQANPGEMENLTRHLICADVETGKILWQKDIKAVLPEDPYTGVGVPAHGYASHTPVSDGKHVYAFLGKSGVYAYDMNGEEVWNADVGKESDPTKWGSSSSPIIYKNIVIVTASAESQAIVGLDKTTGKELWRQEAGGLDGMWGTPTLVKVDDNRTDIVMCVAKELWGLDPENGKLRWFADATGAQHAYSSIVANDNRVFAFTGRGGGSIALDVGSSGDISQTNTVWTGRDNASFASPVKHGSKLYVVARGIVNVVDAETGENVKKMRLKGAKKTGGRFGTLDYPSPIVINDKMFYMNGSGQMYVFELGDELKQVAVNQVTNDKEVFWGSPAVSNGRMVIRSSKHLYCVKDKGEEVSEEDTANAQGDLTEEEEAPQQGNRRRFDPMEAFTRMDTDKDEILTEEEYGESPMADRLKTLDKDESGGISKEEFRTGISSLLSRGGGRRGGGAGGGNGRVREDKRPDRPQRPKPAFEAAKAEG